MSAPPTPQASPEEAAPEHAAHDPGSHDPTVRVLRAPVSRPDKPATDPTEAHDRCTQPSFSGGPVLLSQWYDDTRAYDMTCKPDGLELMKHGPRSGSS